MKRSLRLNFFLILSGFIFFLSALHYLASQMFLERYYTEKKIRVIADTYEQLIELYRKDPASLPEHMDKLSYDRSLNMITIPRDGISEEGAGRAKILLHLLPKIQNGKVLRENGGYIIRKVEAGRLVSDVVVLSGSLPGEQRQLLIYISLSVIRDSVRIVNEFLVVSGAFAGLIGLLLSIVTADKLTKPIIALTKMSKRMKSLDFSLRYEEKRRDEIQVLGDNMNALAVILDQTLTELKAKNNQLALDIHRKQRLEDMRREFVRDASHQLKTPIAIIKGYAEGLADGIADDDESRSAYVNTIYKEANRMENLVRKLLKIARLEAAGHAIHFQRFDLGSLVQDRIASFVPFLEQKQIRLHCALPNGLMVYADRDMMAEVLSNYLSNAVHHVDESRTIEITLGRLESGVRVDVYNSGQLIPQEEMENIWRPFHMLDHEEGYQGDGLGLSIVAAILKLHNRDFGVRNREHGVVFWFEVETDESDYS